MSRTTVRSIVLFATLGALMSGCAHAPKAYARRITATPAGERKVPGAARNTAYMTRVSMEHNIAHIVVLESSQCPVIRMRIVHEIEEMLDGDKVVQRVDKGSREISETENALMECETRFARVPVQLQYGANTYPLGATNEYGALDVDLASVMKVNTRATDLSDENGMLIVAGSPSAPISMAGLLKQQQRLDELISHLTPLLSKDATKLTDGDMTNASMLYQELRELAPDDARTVALQRRYVEVLGGFKGIQTTAALKRNLAALSEAKELLAALGTNNVVPGYVQIAMSSDGPTADSIAWARAQALLSLRSNATLCAGGFDWTRVVGLQGASRLAFTYLRYAFADDTSWLAQACNR